MRIQCPACGQGLEFEEVGSAVAFDRPCTYCGQRVVARDAGAGSPASSGDYTVPFQMPAVPERRSRTRRASDVTVAPGGQPPLRLPRDGRVSVMVMSGPRKGDIMVLQRPRLLIGREGGEADLQLPDPEISRSHAMLECHGERVVLRDLGSRNGTFVRGKRAVQHELSDQTEFRVGATDLMLVVTERG